MLNVNSKVNILNTGINPFNLGIKDGIIYDNKSNKKIAITETKVGFRKYLVKESFNSYKKGDTIYCLHLTGDANYYFSHNKENDNLFDEALQHSQFNDFVKYNC